MQMHVLVIDDDQGFSHLLSAHLTRQGHEVTVADDGLQGQRIARLVQPDVITIDYRMPAANGLIVTERLQSSTDTQNIPIVMLTGSPLEGLTDRLLEAGVSEILSKLTLTETDLVEALESAVERHAAKMTESEDLLFPGDV